MIETIKYNNSVLATPRPKASAGTGYRHGGLRVESMTATRG